MSDVPPSAVPPSPGPSATPPAPRPPRPTPPPPANNSFLGCAFTLSLLLNVAGGLLLVLLCLGVFVLRKPDNSLLPLAEQHYSGKSGADDKVAIIRLDGIIVEGLLSYVRRQIDQAAGDRHVKAVVLRVNSPGGSITASDDVHHRLTELRDGNPNKGHPAKPLVVSMGSMAASGGYYVAMPGRTLFAERTTMTGSIGVYSSFPNVKKLGDKYGVTLTTIKQGQIKDSGSPFGEMSDHERQVWQDLVDDAYQRFVQVVEEGRPALAGGKLLRPIRITPLRAGPDFLKKGDPPPPYERYLADGGVWTASKALELKLIDQIGTLDDAVQAAHDAAQLGDTYRAIKYERPSTLADMLGIGVRTNGAPAGSLLDPARLEAGLMPRVWYLAPGAEASGFLAAARE